MSSVTSAQSPTHASSASTATASSPTNQTSIASPPGPSTASSLSSPAFPPLPPLAGPAGLPHHHAGGPHVPVPAPPPPPSRSSAGPSSSPQHPHPQPQPPHSHLQSSLPSPSAQRQVEEARRAVVASIGNMLDNELQGRAAVLHGNQAAIEKQFRDVERATAGLRRDNDRLGRVAAEHARKVKEVGNVQNWAELLERDFLVLEETMRLVREGSSGGSSWSGSGSGSWSGSASGSEAGDERDGEGDVNMDDAQQDAPEAQGDSDKGKGKAKEVFAAEHMDVDAAQVPLPSDDQSLTEVGSSSTSAPTSHESETTLASTPVV